MKGSSTQSYQFSPSLAYRKATFPASGTTGFATIVLFLAIEIWRKVIYAVYTIPGHFIKVHVFQIFLAVLQISWKSFVEIVMRDETSISEVPMRICETELRAPQI